MMNETVNFAWPTTAISKEDYDAIRNCAYSNSALFKEKKIIIFGAGIRGTEFSVILEDEGYCDIVFTDNNAEKWGGCIDKYPIIPPKEAFTMRQESVFLISTEEGKPIAEQLAKEGLVEGTHFFVPKSNLYDQFMREFVRNVKDHALVMGDCMFEVVSFHDVNKDSLAEMLVQQLGTDRVKLLTMHGMGMRAFYHLLKAQVTMGFKPDVFVVMINFETLTGKQHLLPRSQHTELIQSVFDASKDLDDGELAEYVRLTQERVKNIQAEFFTTHKFSSEAGTNKTGDIGRKAAKLFFKLNYMYKLDPQIESVQYLIRIYKYARENGIHVIPFVPPVNFELGEEIFQEKFDEAYSHNYQIIEEITEKNDISLLDLSHTCKREQFAESSTPDETTNYEGRCIVAEKIVNEIKNFRG